MVCVLHDFTERMNDDVDITINEYDLLIILTQSVNYSGMKKKTVKKNVLKINEKFQFCHRKTKN